MHTEAALAVLGTARPEADDIDSELGTRGDIAFLHMRRRAQPEHWAVVSTPGDRWFSLDVAGRFSADHFAEDTPEDEVRRRLQQYVALAVRYLRGGGVLRRSRWLRLPSIVLSGEGTEVVLRRSFSGQLRIMLGGSAQLPKSLRDAG